MKILIVDDELIVRQWFVMTVEKLGGGYEVVGQAGNGWEALEFCKKNMVDIVVTDIKMPVMDGIELVQILSHDFPKLKVIILSAYNEFEYAKKAMKYGAGNYILKAEITPDDLRGVLDGARDEILDEREKSLEISKLKKAFHENKYSLRSMYFKNIIWDSSNSLEEFEDKISSLGIKLDRIDLLLGIFKIENGKGKEKEDYDFGLIETDLIGIVDEALEIKFGNGCAFSYGKDSFIILLNPGDYNEKGLGNFFDSLGRGVIQRLKLPDGIFICAGFSSLYKEGKLYNQFNEAVEALNRTWTHGDRGNRILFYHGMNAPDTDCIGKGLTLLIKEFSVWLDRMDIDSLGQTVKSLSHRISGCQDVSVFEIRDFCIEIIYLLIQKMRELGVAQNEIDHISHDLHKEIYGCITLTDLFKKVNDKVSCSIDYIQSKLKYFSPPIQKAYDYIRTNFHKEISLGFISDYVFLNRSYFSELFKNEVGESYNDFLTRVRIQEAIKLIKTENIKISELGYNVGYRNPSYFSRIFKKHTGFTPVEYKRRYEGK